LERPALDRPAGDQLSAGSPVVQAKDPDAMLVRACLAGDSTAYEVLVHRYSGPLYNAAYRITHSREDAVDAIQSAFVNAWRRLDSFDFSHRFFSWIYRIAVNEALDMVARRRREAVLDESVPVPTVDPGAERAEAERTELVQRALMELKPAERAIVVLKHFRGLSYPEIAEILGIPEKKVKSRLFEARERLRRVMRQRGWL
jgi:RNA polymerase sigma-70 factor (ECF subfamily)